MVAHNPHIWLLNLPQILGLFDYLESLSQVSDVGESSIELMALP